MSGRGLKARATRPALSRAAAYVRSRAKGPRYKARAPQVCGGCQETRAKGPRHPGLRRMSGDAGYRPALPGVNRCQVGHNADVRSRAKGPRYPGLRRMSGRGLKARATRAALPRAAADVRSRAKSPRYKARATRPAPPRAALHVIRNSWF